MLFGHGHHPHAMDVAFGPPGAVLLLAAGFALPDPLSVGAWLLGVGLAAGTALGAARVAYWTRVGPERRRQEQADDELRRRQREADDDLSRRQYTAWDEARRASTLGKLDVAEAQIAANAGRIVDLESLARRTAEALDAERRRTTALAHNVDQLSRRLLQARAWLRPEPLGPDEEPASEIGPDVKIARDGEASP